MPDYQLVLGKLSGKRVLKDKLNKLGLNLNRQEVKGFTKIFKDNSEKKKFVTDDDVINLLERFKKEVGYLKGE